MELISAAKKHFKFSKEEVRDLVIVSILVGFMFSFTQWGTDKLDVNVGLKNLAIACMLTALAFLVHVSAQKIAAIKQGYNASFQKYMPGLMLGLMLTIVMPISIKSYNNLAFPIIVAGGIAITAFSIQRLGHEKPIIKHSELAVLTFMGPLANVILALIFKAMINTGMNVELAKTAMAINGWIAIFSILPIALVFNPLLMLTLRSKAPTIPAMDGSTIFYASRIFYGFAAAFVIACSATMFYINPIAAALSATIIGLVAMIVIIKTFEI